jgi:uncharacterized protein YecE (DUF72 family)
VAQRKPAAAGDPRVAAIRVGISGWRYEPWRGPFYPERLPQREELHYASRVLPSIEINGSFYSLQRPESYASWYADTPAEFVFTVKGGRYITHIRRLRDVGEPLANFFASGLFELREKLGPILWQFPPNFKYDRPRMESFLEQLPHTADAARALARRHSDWMKGRATLAATDVGPIRHAIEIRHESFLDPTFAELLRSHNVAFVVAETARQWPMTDEITADFVYMRLHGDKELYRGGYGDEALERWAQCIRTWHDGSEPPSKTKGAKPLPRDVFCYFDNTDVKLRAPFDAQTLMRKLGIVYAPAPTTAERREVEAGAVEPSTKRAAPARTRKAAATRVKPKRRPAKATTRGSAAK